MALSGEGSAPGEGQPRPSPLLYRPAAHGIIIAPDPTCLESDRMAGLTS